jgi:hypothetical protein
MLDASSAAAVLEAEPIFVCGAPRSGVRLLAAILDGHARLASGPELPFILTMAQQWRDIETTLGRNHERHYGLAPAYVRTAFGTTILQLVSLRLQATGKARFVFQSFGVTLLLDTLAALFPSARFVLCVRDPRDAACSLQNCDWRDPRNGSRLPYTLDVQLAARFLNDYLQLALPKVDSLLAARRLWVVRYEDLCLDSAEQLRALGEFLGEAAPLARVGADSAALVAASHDNEHLPPQPGELSAGRIGCWRERLSLPQRAVVERLTASIRRRFDYESSSG